MIASAILDRVRGPHSDRLRQASTHAGQRVAALTTVFLMAVAGAGSTATAQDLPDTMLPLQIDAVIIDDGQLIALGSLGDTTFALPAKLSLVEIIEDDTDVCAILELEIGEIHLDLLGLQVETSDICLLIEAHEGSGNLLGNLLCGIAGLLDTGLPLGDILAGLSAEETDVLVEGLAGLLDGALAEATSPSSVQGVSGSASQGKGKGKQKDKDNKNGADDDNIDTTCDILNLAVGPVDLNLLGLHVHLDNCVDGPVTVDITAEPGAGNLLGNLLCSLAGLLDQDPLDLDAIDALLILIAEEILNLINLG